ncbi:MAG: glycoside hydrolase family 130 protein [Candidatus Methanospirareceae archaeon]
MKAQFVYNIQELGGGEVVSLDSGEKIFKLHSYEGNPIIKPQDFGLEWYEEGEKKIGAIFNGGAEVFDNKIILAPRCHRNYKKVRIFGSDEEIYFENYISEVWLLESRDGIHFSRKDNVIIRGDGTDHKDFVYGIEDIRIVKYEDQYLLIGCGKVEPPYIGRPGYSDRMAIYSTSDFINITYHGIVDAFDVRNGVVFPEEVEGKLYMLLRFYANRHPHIHIDYLEAGIDQLLNPSKYREQWRKIYERKNETVLLKSGVYPHEKVKIGPGTQLIKTKKGWLLIYHAVGELKEDICKAYGLEGGIRKGYSICAAILDLNNPRKVLCRTKKPIYIPSAPYELYGNEEYPVDVPAVVFPVGAVVYQGKLLIYAGATDKYIVLLSCNLDNLINYLWKYCRYEEGDKG